MSAQTQPAFASPTAEPVLGAISPAQLAANRANAALSSGPRTEAGKARSSQNALKSALTGRTVLLPTDDRAEYEALLSEFRNHYRPEGLLESDLVQVIADCHWRLRRIQFLENLYYVHGETQFAEMFKHLDPAEAHAMTMLQTHMTYGDQFRNLATQEARIDRKRQNAIKELKALQDNRTKKCGAEEAAEQAPACHPSKSENDFLSALAAGYIPPELMPAIKRRQQESDAVSENGFEFSNALDSAPSNP